MADTKTSIIISAEDKTAAAFASAKNGLQGLEAAASRLPVLGAALATAFSGAAFTAAIGDAIKFTASLDDMAEKTGASVETLSALARVAQIGGHDLGLVETAAIKLAKGLADADEKSSAAGRALRALKLDPAQLRAMDTAEALKLVAGRLNEYKDGAGKTALAMDLLGKSGAQALPFLKDLAESGDLVATTTAKQAAEAEKFEKALAKLKVQAAEAGRSLVNELIPALNKFLETANQPGAGLMGAAVANIDNAIFGRGDIKARLDEARKQLADAEARKTSTGTVFGGGIMGAYNDAQIEKLKSVVVAYKEMYAAQVLASNSASYSNEGRIAGLRDLAYVGSDAEKNPKKAVDLTNQQAAAVLSLREALQGASGDASEFDKVVLKLTEGSWSKFNQETQVALLSLAGEVDETKAATKAAQDYANQKERLLSMLDTTQWDKYNQSVDMSAKLLRDGVIGLEQYDELLQKLGKDLPGVAEKHKEVFKDLEHMIDGWGKSTSGAIADMVVEGKGSLSDLARSFEKEMLQMILYEGMFKGVSAGVSDWAAGLFATKKNADGGVYTSASLSRYSGGVYDSPRVFAFAKGAGIFGEAGPEAIMPLKRGADGKLGVQSSGGGVIINNYTGQPVTTREVSDGRGGRALEVQIGEAVAAQMLTSGSMANRARGASTMVRRG